MIKLDYGFAFYLDGFECDIEDIEKIINERNDLREEKQKFYDFIDENESLLKQVYILDTTKSIQSKNQYDDIMHEYSLQFIRNFIKYLNDKKDSLK